MDPIPFLESENPLWLFCNLRTNVKNVSSWTHPIYNWGGGGRGGWEGHERRKLVKYTNKHRTHRGRNYVKIPSPHFCDWYCDHGIHDFSPPSILWFLYSHPASLLVWFSHSLSHPSFPVPLGYLYVFFQFLTSIPPNHCKHLWAPG